ncbi:MAG: hypothetical protein IJZ35_04320 [Clostridia bacterium]|nr:hypothetical protein [Clostridia bacterium]
MKKLSKKLLAVLLIIAMLIPSSTMAITSNAATVSIPDDAVMYNGHYYKAYNISKSWTDAKTYCENLGGHLVTITSQDEQSFIEKQFLTDSPAKEFYLAGGYRIDYNSNVWFWITDESFDYSKWGGNGWEANQPVEGQLYIWLSSSIYSHPHHELFAWISHQNANYTNETWNTNKAGFICEWEPNEQIITGKITGSSNTPKIAIDGIWYYYDTSVSGLADAIDKFAINENISCKLKFGKIVACSKNQIKSTALLSVNTFNNVTYDATKKEYDYEKININLNITNSIKSTQYGKINTEYIAGYDVTFDKLVINVQEGDMLYFKDGLFDLGKTQELEIELDSPVTLKAGKVFNYTENIYAFINDDYEWGETETKKDVKIVAYAYNGDTLVAIDDQTVTFKNTAAENNIKNQAEIDKKAENAAKLLNNTACVIQNEFLSEIFTKDELKAISDALQCKVALCALPESTYKKAGISEKIMNKLMSKAGINSDWFGASYTADISLVVNVDTQKYGLLEIEFCLPTTFYSFGSDNPFAGVSFDISYEITGGKGKKNVPENNLTADTLGMLTYANMQSFASSVQDIALDQLENAFDLGYGNDLNKVGEMLFGETMTKILSKTAAKSYSHLTFSLMTFPSKQVKIHCPVDVYVYDTDGNLCASVEGNEITMTCDDIDIEVVGDEKYLTIYEGEYSIEVIATANDTMDITIEEYSSTDEMIRTVAFDDVELTPGDSFKTDIDEIYLDNDYPIEKNDEDIIVADSNIDYIHRVNSVEIIDRDATCTQSGEYHIVCAECGETVLTGTIPEIGHNDSDHNGFCDFCATDFTASCSHICHSENSFMQFIWKIAKFIYRIFGINQYCDCGMAHW